MTDAELVAAIGAGAGGLGVFARWAVRLWAQVRREGIEQAKATSAQQRADSTRMVDALIANERSNAQLAGAFQTAIADLAGKFGALATKLDTLLDWRERTPVEGYERQPHPDDPPSERTLARRRARTPAHQQPGYRAPRGGTHNDGDDR